MVDTSQDVQGAGHVPEGRYGRKPRGSRTDPDRRLKITGGVLGALLLGLVAWIGVSYISGEDISGEMIKFKVVSDSAVEVHLEVRKEVDAEGVCTLRAIAESGAEVGRKDVSIAKGEDRIDSVFKLRTLGRATAAELVGCEKG